MRHWVFDLDGTLVDSFDYYLEFSRQVFSANGVEFLAHHQAECLGSPALPFLSKHLSESVAHASLADLRKQSLIDATKIRPFAGVEDQLSELRRRGSRLAVWTNRDRGTTDKVLECTGLDRFMDLVVTGCCVPRHKPHPDGMIKILTAFDCEAHEVTMVGDHDVDVEAALASGTRPLRAAWHRHDPPTSCSRSAGLVSRVDQLSEWFDHQ